MSDHVMTTSTPKTSLWRGVVGVVAVAAATHAAAQITFYQRDGFDGQSFTTRQPIDNFERFGFNDRASSVYVASARWEVCEDPHYGGRCVVVRPGRYPTLVSLGLNNRVSSVRPVAASAR